MYFNFNTFLQMSLFIKQANLCLPTTKTTEMIKFSISSLFCLFLDISEKSIGHSISSLRPIPIPIPKKKADTGRYRYFGTSLLLTVSPVSPLRKMLKQCKLAICMT